MDSTKHGTMERKEEHLTMNILMYYTHKRSYMHNVMGLTRSQYDVDCCQLTELSVLSFPLHFVCASYELDVYMRFELHHAIFTMVQSIYFCESCSECIELVK